MEQELKPCPFCGERENLIIRTYRPLNPQDYNSDAVWCLGCGASIHGRVPSDDNKELRSAAIIAWNTRAEMKENKA